MYITIIIGNKKYVEKTATPKLAMMMMLNIYFLILFSKRKTLQSNNLQFELKAFVLFC